MGHNKLRLLLVEDDPGHGYLIQKALKKASPAYHVDWTTTLTDGLDRLKLKSVDVVLTDLSLPDSAGLNAVQRIRESNDAVAIIVLTSLDDGDTEDEALRCGAQDYLIKNEATPYALERAIQHARERQQGLVATQNLLAEVEASRKLLARQQAQLKKKNQRLRRLCKTAQRFVDNVSHDFRTPLTVIKDYVSLVREGNFGEVNAEQAQMLDVATVRVDDLNTMVDDMLDVSRLEAGMLAICRRPCEISDIINYIVPSLRQKSVVKQITFGLEVPSDLPTIYCDREQVSRVIVNLMTNAMKFCGEAGNVRLSVHPVPSRGELVVAVTDNGPGIDPSNLECIFQRFKQLKVNVKQSTKGFGLGLNIAQELVALNLGQMHVESQLGRGSTFSFTVPVAESREVLRRYLAWIQKTNKKFPAVSMLSMEIDASIPPAHADDVDLFLGGLLRQNDLLWRFDARHWIVLIVANEAERGRFLERMENERDLTIRNRPGDPLPPVRITPTGTWHTAEQARAIIDHLNPLSDEAESATCCFNEQPLETVSTT